MKCVDILFGDADLRYAICQSCYTVLSEMVLLQ